MLPTELGEGGLLFALGMAAACFFLMRRTARRISQQRRQPVTPPSVPAVQPRGSLGRGDAAKCEVALHDLARDLQGELETKSRVLQILIAQAREEAQRLERLLAAGEGSATPADEEGGNSRGTASRLSDPTDASEPFRLAPDVAVAPRPRRPLSPDRGEEVYRRAEAGESAAVIAQSLSRPLADVELLLSLRDAC